MAVDPEMKLNKYNKGKYLLRHAFEGDYLPYDILMREKAAFSDAVGHSMVDYLKEYAEAQYTDSDTVNGIFKPEVDRRDVRDGNATAWRLESSLREFPNITPINFWFEYPIHRVDVGGILGGMPAQGTPKAGKLNNPKSKSSDEAADEFRTAYDALNMDGKVTVADLADYLGISDKTVYSRLKKMDGEYLLEKGAIRRSAPAQ